MNQLRNKQIGRIDLCQMDCNLGYFELCRGGVERKSSILTQRMDTNRLAGMDGLGFLCLCIISLAMHLISRDCEGMQGKQVVVW